MAQNQLGNDLRQLLFGISKVTKAHLAIRRATAKTIIDNSSVLKATGNLPKIVEQSLPQTSADLSNLVQRASMVGHGVTQFASVAAKNLYRKNFNQQESAENSSGNNYSNAARNEDDVVFIREEDLEGLYIKSLGVEVLQQNEDGKKYDEAEKIAVDKPNNVHETPLEVKADLKTEKNDILQDLKAQLADKQESASLHSSERNSESPKIKVTPPIVPPGVKPLSTRKPVSQLAATSKERKVPASRIGRLVSYGGLAAGLGFGAISEVTKRTFGLKKQDEGVTSLVNGSPFLTEANAQRIVDTMCRVRGAALKIGQILSIQDNSLINPELQKVFERVRSAADFMPTWQMEKMLASELGSDWRSKLEEFEDKPFAAASIGQVHLGKLLDKRPVAIKIQYPGVAKGISSDIDNLVSVLNVWNIIPDGVFIDSIITVAKRELGWEVDYLREAECATKFRQLLQPYPDYYVPEVITELTTKQVYTTELIEGIPVDKCESLDQETRDRVSFLLLDLFFRELYEFRFMQTDPNWSNFLYNTETKQIGLLDFGASREYSKEFVRKYAVILKGAAENDRKLVLEYSQKIGFLTGYESKAMENAHIDTVMLLGEAFRIGDEAYDFGSQNLTARIQQLVPVMVSERLCPPPEEVYSLHRKLSGMFLLCTKLKGRVKCRPIFDRVSSAFEKELNI